MQTAERDQERFGGIFPQLLRLCSSHFPHLCLVQDWLSNDDVKLREYENVDLTIIHDPEVASRSGVGESQFVTESSVKELKREAFSWFPGQRKNGGVGPP